MASRPDAPPTHNGSTAERRLSFRGRLSLLVALAVGVAVVLASLSAYFLVKHELYSQLDGDLTAQVQGAINQGPNGANIDLRALTRAGRAGDAVQLVTRSGQVVLSIQGSQPVANAVIPVTPAALDLARPEAAGAQSFTSAHIGTTHVRVLAQGLGPVVIRSTGQTASMVLEVASPLTLVDHTLADLWIIFVLVAAAGVIAALGLGYAVARATIRPVERLTAAAEHVASTQDLNAIIDEVGDDELSRLARAFNSMLTALSASRTQQTQLVADAGHELRTPLTSLRTNIEVLMRARRLNDADREQLLSDVKAQLEELTTLVGDLVELAREDERETEPVDVRFDHVVARAAERAQRRAGRLAFAVDTDAGMVRAQPALLERAVLNVLDNAVKWSPPGEQVTVTLRRGDVWTLDVRDRGPGISAADLPRVFDRFYRAEAARALPGSGLGLAIVRQVVEANGGRVDITCPPDGGTVVHVELPTVAEDAPPPSQDAPPRSWADVPVPSGPGAGGPPDRPASTTAVARGDRSPVVEPWLPSDFQP